MVANEGRDERACLRRLSQDYPSLYSHQRNFSALPLPTIMLRFITGDELGSLKVLRYSADAEQKTELKTVHDGSASGKLKTVQRLGITSTFDGSKLVGQFF